MISPFAVSIAPSIVATQPHQIPNQNQGQQQFYILQNNSPNQYQSFPGTNCPPFNYSTLPHQVIHSEQPIIQQYYQQQPQQIEQHQIGQYQHLHYQQQDHQQNQQHQQVELQGQPQQQEDQYQQQDQHQDQLQLQEYQYPPQEQIITSQFPDFITIQDDINFPVEDLF